MSQDLQQASLFGGVGSPRWRERTVRVGARTLFVSPVFETYWRFAALRQTAYFARLAGEPRPWVDDRIIEAHRFTNAYRAADRVSQFLLRNVQYSREWGDTDVIFRTLIFKFFNRIETWEALVERVGEPTWATYEFDAYRDALDDRIASGAKVYSAAYIVPQPPYGESRKHGNHLRLVEVMVGDDLAARLHAAPSMQAAYEILRGYPSLGPFLAYQLLIDLNYSSLLAFDEMEFVVAGPGARDGLRKCFVDAAGLSDADLIRYVADTQQEWFERLELDFRTLWGRPLQLVDCQNLFCEVDKYARVAHPDVAGASGRTRIKQSFHPSSRPLDAWFPPKWALRTDLASSRHTLAHGVGSRI